MSLYISAWVCDCDVFAICTGLSCVLDDDAELLFIDIPSLSPKLYVEVGFAELPWNTCLSWRQFAANVYVAISNLRFMLIPFKQCFISNTNPICILLTNQLNCVHIWKLEIAFKPAYRLAPKLHYFDFYNYLLFYVGTGFYSYLIQKTVSKTK